MKENTYKKIDKEDLWMLAQIHPKVQLWFISLVLKEICKVWDLPNSDYSSLYKHFKNKYKL